MKKDKDNVNISLYFPQGDISEKDLIQIANVMKRYNLSMAKITGGKGITLANLPKNNVAEIKNELGLTNKEKSSNIRTIQACGSLDCRKGVSNAPGFAKILRTKTANLQLPGKVKVAVSGCEHCCMQSMVRDLGFIAKPEGWTVTAGGITGGVKPRVADMLAENLNEEEAVKMAVRILKIYSREANGKERLGNTIDRLGLQRFKKEINLTG
ncbi:MAG: hypothetical protein FH758_13810 [Firmicutes bacterium]|nr:hypothetical protein [Bacillota bacterium]